jgi:large subunit ribosomal protein L9
MNVEVILREDVQHLGKAGALVKVRPGYARNFLLPRGLAYEATEGNKQRILAEQKARTSRLAAERGDAEALAARLRGVRLTHKARAGEGDRLFGSVTNQDLAAGLAALGFAIDRRKIDLDHPLKELGTHTVGIRLHPEVRAEITVVVEQE